MLQLHNFLTCSGGCDGVRAKWMQVVGQNTRLFFFTPYFSQLFHFAHFASVFWNLKLCKCVCFYYYYLIFGFFVVVIVIIDYFCSGDNFFLVDHLITLLITWSLCWFSDHFVDSVITFWFSVRVSPLRSKEREEKR